MTIKNVKEERKDASAKSSHHLVAFKVIKKRKKKKEFTASPFTWKTMSEFRSIVQLKFGE